MLYTELTHTINNVNGDMNRIIFSAKLDKRTSNNANGEIC